MSLSVQTISKQVIKPSSPTPHHLNSVQLSSLDQTAPQIYTHLLLFYSNIPNTTHQTPTTQVLKKSLSQALTTFYPLAGRIKPSNTTATLHVDCNDDGVEFTESQTESELVPFLLNPPIDQLTHLLPIKCTEFRWHDEDPLLALQLTAFNRGGFALGVSVSHLIADGASIAFFLNSWADINAIRRNYLDFDFPPRFDAASVFPPQSQLSDRPPPCRLPPDAGVVIKRFVMTSESMGRLRSHARTTEAPTRVEAVSALVKRCLVRAKEETVTSLHVVNLRRKMAAVLSERSMGNLWISVAAATEEGIGRAVRRVDEEYVRRRERSGWKGEGEGGGGCNWVFSSWCGIPFYRCDFGWGEPVWVGCGIRDMKDVCILIDGKGGDGIEVWLWLEREEMERVEMDQEFLKFVSSH